MLDMMPRRAETVIGKSARGIRGESGGHFRAYLLGRIAYVGLINPARGAKLRRLFDRIGWAGES
ncbi:MAG TPA: hypothetical protein VKA46_39220 [Gemmataceae bacterium]|nr:hypothetical protein [Gemmataceae bacterium]